MITEDYVSFETAKLLKEKGFNWIVTRSFFEHDNCYAPCDPSEVPRKDAIAIPTLQMVMKWLRKVHNLFIVIDRRYFVVDRISHIASGFKYSIEIKTINTIYTNNDYKSYEEACEVAIKYILENLI